MRADDGSYKSTPLYDKLNMLHYCLPALLLQVPPFATHAQKTKLICSNCTRFLEGSWRSLVTEATRDITESNAQARDKAARAPTGLVDPGQGQASPSSPPAGDSDPDQEEPAGGAGAAGGDPRSEAP